MTISRGRRIAAVLVALLMPAGSGHFVLGRWARGVAWGASMLVIYPLTLVWPVPAVMVVSFIALLSLVDVAVLPGNSSVEPPRVGRAALAVLAFTAVVAPLRYAERFLLVEPFVTPGDAMAPTLLTGDHFLVDHTVRTPAHGDIVAFRAQDLVFVSRIAAVGGDTVTIHPGEPPALNRSGASAAPCQPSPAHAQVVDVDCTVPNGAVFVLGDNFEHSLDSRHRGPIALSDVIGRAMAIHFSSEGFTVRWSRIGSRLDRGSPE